MIPDICHTSSSSTQLWLSIVEVRLVGSWEVEWNLLIKDLRLVGIIFITYEDTLCWSWMIDIGQPTTKLFYDSLCLEICVENGGTNFYGSMVQSR